MRERAARWFAAATSRAEDWPPATLLAAKAAAGARVSVVVPARNEAATIASVVTAVRAALVDDLGLVDELVVMDSRSDDGTARIAAGCGARVFAVDDVAPEYGSRAGKGEALWKSQFVTTGDVVVFIDADLVEWGTHFVTGLLGPLLADPGVLLVRGFYDRVLDDGHGAGVEGGRVTELVARPLLNLRWPALGRVVQPLAGEWAARRSLMAALPVPVGYGVELSTLIDTYERFGLDAIAQVDLGRRAHRHQSVHDLGVMATEILRVAEIRSAGGSGAPADAVATLAQFVRDAGDGGWVSRPVPVGEREPYDVVTARAAI